MDFEAAVETYLSDLQRRHATGAATAETSFYGPLESLLNTIGHHLKPKVLCVGQLRDTGAGRPDFGLFTANQCQRGEPRMSGEKAGRGRGSRRFQASGASDTISLRN